MIIGAQSWRAIVLAARFERRRMESAHFLAAPGGEGDMQMPCRLFAGAKPEFRAAVASQPRPTVKFHRHVDYERRQGRDIEGATGGEVGDRKSHMIEHPCLSTLMGPARTHYAARLAGRMRPMISTKASPKWATSASVDDQPRLNRIAPLAS